MVTWPGPGKTVKMANSNSVMHLRKFLRFSVTYGNFFNPSESYREMLNSEALDTQAEIFPEVFGKREK